MEPVGPEIPLDFWEVNEASDALLIGNIELSEWGTATYRDEDGRHWVRFEKFDICIPAETPAIPE